MRAEIDSFHGKFQHVAMPLARRRDRGLPHPVARPHAKLPACNFRRKLRQNAARVRWHGAGSPAVQRAGPFSAGPCFRGLGVEFAPRSLCKKGDRGSHRARRLSGRGFGPARGACESRSEAVFRALPGVLGWLTGSGRKEPPVRGPLHLGRGRARQDDADGSVFRGGVRRAQIPRPFSRFHGHGPRLHPCVAPRAAHGFGQRRRPGRGGGGCHRPKDLALMFRRVQRHRHHRCDDPWPAFRGFVRPRRRHRRDIQCAAGPASTRMVSIARSSCRSSV